MKKVGLFINTSAGGGAFQYCQSMLDAVASLSQHDINPIVYYTDSSWQKYLKDYKLISRFIQPRHFLSSKIVYSIIKLLPVKLSRIILAQIDPAIKMMIAENCNLWIFPSRDEWMFLIKVKQLSIIHDLMHRYEQNFPENHINGEYERREQISKNACKYSVGVITDSELGRKQFAESYNYSMSKIYSLPYIPPSYIYKINSNNNLLSKLHLPKEYIFYPAQFWLHKNHSNLVKAVALLRKKLPNINLVLAGFKSKNYSNIEKLVKKLNLTKQVHFLGYVEDEIIVELYIKAKMLVMPTFFGPTNIPPIEAFALNCPVATSNIYAASDQLGDAALLFNPKSVRSIASAIEKIWLDKKLREELIKRGKIWTNKWGQKQFNNRLWEIVEENI